MSHIAKAARVFLAILREIFDETSYERFLRRMQMESSPAAYAAFSRERDLIRQRRPRCC